MWKNIAAFILIGALCYLAEGATYDDLQGAINEAGAEVRVASVNRIKAASALAHTSATTRQQKNCIHQNYSVAFAELNTAMNKALQERRAEARTSPPEDLDTLTRIELKEDFKKCLEDAVESIVKKYEDDFSSCVQ